MKANEIREAFVRFFESKNHLIVPSAPMVVKDDPTLMFTNAGMNQFKDIILGHKEPKCRRITDSQKCLRVSGKHNDLEEVGHDTYHHTMFEMLGNWSFGDYFKEEAIAWAYEFLVEVLQIDPKNLYVTVFEGSKEEGVERDDEAAGYWEKYFPKSHIINGNKKDNFWEMGDTGPCGPCSEIHIDLRSEEEKQKIDGATLVNKDNPQVMEIWNLVFMQYNRKADGSLESLPAKVIDTGMGFERLCMVMQGKQSNYDTDVFQSIIQKIAELSNFTYGKEVKVDVAMRVVADHLRTIAFSIADGQLPSNAKAGYVIRRILRRAVRYAYTFLDQKEAFIYQLVPTLANQMGEAYPELVAQKELITKVIKEEEESFLRTLSTGISRLEAVIEKAKSENQKQINGKEVFTLFDTFGFPLDLTELICSEQGIKVDIETFHKEMQKQKERARNATSQETGDWVVLKEEDTTFVGWDFTETNCYITRYRKIEQKNKVFYELVLNQTPFYAEMGGQVGDKGVICNEAETIEIIDTKSENNLTVHYVVNLPQNPNAEFMACVDTDARRATEANHSATHLLDQALREVLGDHVEQKGSLVTPTHLRFDISHFQKISKEEIREVERKVNQRIRENLPLQEYRMIPIAEAKEMGAIALFGEKYGDEVRVIQFGQSVEFCGGCHVKNTGQIGSFYITSESSVAAGVRRIEAVTGKAAEELYYTQQDLLSDLYDLLHTSKDLKTSLQKMIEENEGLKNDVSTFIREKVNILKDKLIEKAEHKGNITLIRTHLKVSADIAKDLAFRINAQIPENLVCLIASEENNKPMLTVMFSKNLVETLQLNAGTLVREVAKLIQGGGGGAPHFATAGGKNIDGLTAALDKLVELINL